MSSLASFLAHVYLSVIQSSGYVLYDGDLAKETEKPVQNNNNYVSFAQVSLLISHPGKDMLHHQDFTNRWKR